MLRPILCLITGPLIAVPETGFAQGKPAYSDEGRVQGCFSATDETCNARCGRNTACASRCPIRCLTPEETRNMLRSLKAANSNSH